MSHSNKGALIMGDGYGFRRIDALGARCGPLGSMSAITGWAVPAAELEAHE